MNHGLSATAHGAGVGRSLKHLPALAAALLLAAAPARAQAPAAGGGAGDPMRIAVLDTGKLIAESALGKKASENLKRLAEEKMAAVKARAVEVEELRKKLDAGRTSLAAEALARMEREIDDKTTAGRRLKEDSERMLDAERDRILKDIDTAAMPIITQIGRERHYTVILRKFESGLVYADESADITGLVIQRLDAMPAK